MSDRVAVAQIGVGRWGVNLIRVLAGEPGCTVKYVCDADPETARAAAERANAAPTDDIDTVLGDESVQAVVIATPSGLHFEHVAKAIRAGKHVFVEKPMTTTVADAETVVEMADAAGVQVMVGHTFLYNDVVRNVRQRIEAGEIGDVYYVYSRRLNLGQFRDDSDVLWTLAPHDISIIDYWLDATPEEVSANGLVYAHPQRHVAEVCFAHMLYPGGQAAHLHLSWLDPQKCREMVVIGSKKMLVYDDTQPTRYLQIFDKSVEFDYNDAALDLTDFRSRLRAGDLVIPSIRATEPLVAEMGEFIDCVRTGRRPLTDARHGLESVRIMSAMSQSMAANGRSVRLETAETVAAE